MSQLPSTEPSSPTAASADVPVVEPGLEVQAHAFWEKNRRTILMGCVGLLLVIAGREGWHAYANMHEQQVQADYAKIADQPDKLAAFAESHAGHALAGIAYLQLADQKFEAADYKQAATYYAKAGADLKNAVLLGRSRLGLAMCQISSGDKAAGEAGLKAVGSDQSLLNEVRAEASYHLAVMAVESGNTTEAKAMIDAINKIDMSGPWAQRATMLQAKLPAEAKPADAAAPAITFKP